ncbi:MAG TPA: HEPN domain-containing protein [Armatimonadota bacterium]|nr:HEPN domain-containing protein [Armatimonadota bacterium]
MLHDHLHEAKIWLEYALADLAIARMPLPEHSKYEMLLFHAQQAVEKSLKAILVLRQIEFPYTHSLYRLVRLIPDEYGGRDLLLASTVLTEYAVLSRYPSEPISVDEEQYHHLLGLAEQVFTWAKQVIASSSETSSY